MYKLETHCHSFGGSGCATSPNETFIQDYLSAGYGGVVITNHVAKGCFDSHPGDTYAKKVRYYYSLIEKMTEELNGHGVKVFWGAEIRVLPEGDKPHGEEYTVYGISEKDMIDNKPLYTFTQEELFRFAEKRGLFMYQTHPFRDGVTHGNPAFLHGAEAFNGHFHHYNHNDKAKEFCEKNNLIGMSGTDYHHEHQPITAGIFVPDNICTNEQLTEFIFKKDFKIIADEKRYESAVKAYKENR